ncbi:hypothetical protein HRE53_27315 (plasmid) [Acaryochloris sp. 'Moss Beach']|uniref:hypothetical protein n=1 Tax=Acaryochloris sp. 'Moss Beach' TaxID=2740837 RepID=UPI001F474703|nr:hypothetical protein [Acaryochloris sp. 'Moss Beach']UJB72308.1 hypothetical protein HRE53_27315 [Acaryochloris sp. 'Moss Beach']
MTNATELTQTLGLEQNDLDKLLRACGMSEDGYDLEALQGVLQLKAENIADTYTHGWCIYTADTYKVDLKPIHKAISAEGIETGDDLYHPLFTLVCERVSEEGVDPIDAVKTELQGTDEVEEDASLDDIDQVDEGMKQALKAESLRTARRVARNAHKTSDRVVAAAHQFHMKQLRHDLKQVFAEEWAKEDAQEALEGQSEPGKLLPAEATEV